MKATLIVRGFPQPYEIVKEVKFSSGGWIGNKWGKKEGAKDQDSLGDFF